MKLINGVLVLQIPATPEKPAHLFVRLLSWVAMDEATASFEAIQQAQKDFPGCTVQYQCFEDISDAAGLFNEQSQALKTLKDTIQ